MTVSGVAAKILSDRAFCMAVAVAHRRFEPEMVPIIAACDSDGIAIDIGAWYGPWSHWLSRRVERVVAFEPNPAVARMLAACAPPNVEVHEVALSDEPGALHLSVSGTRRGEEGRSFVALDDLASDTVVVKARTLDSYKLERVRLVKIDVEGYEHAVLRGALTLLNAWHPLLVVELETRFGDVQPVFDMLEAMGYCGRVRVDGRWRRVDVGRLASLQEHRHPVDSGYLTAAARAGGGYVNNVVFVHPRGTWVPW